MNIRKPFSQEIYNETDAVARSRVREYMSSATGLFAVDNEDQYGPDIIVYKGLKRTYYAEVEVKRVWGAGQDAFPWTHINLPERKVKFLKLGLPIEFWILRSDMNMAVVISGEVVEASPSEEVRNKYVPEGELFRKIDITQCNLVDLRGD